MDDFRKRYDVPRRDYGMAPQGQPSPARQIPINSEPAGQNSLTAPNESQLQPPVPQPAAVEMPNYIPPAVQPQAQQPVYHRPDVPAAEQNQVNAKPKSKINRKSAVIAGMAVFLVIAAGYMFIKPGKSAAVMPADLAKQASFDVYYPSSLPNGYIYKENLATYQDGGAYFTFVKGPKHIVIRENVTSSGKLDTNEVTDPQPLDSSVGKAVIGTNTDQVAAAVLAGKTYIFIYSNNSVPKDEITSIVQNLKNIGHK